jgi:uncharacterized membrane protein
MAKKSSRDRKPDETGPFSPGEPARRGLKQVLRHMAATAHEIEVNAPLRAVYNQWTQFEEFPRFMEGIEEVRREGDKRLFWKARIGGKLKEWKAEITHQFPDETIAWKSVDGSSNSGTVIFKEIGADHTKITATIEYEPEGFWEKTGDAFGFPSRRVQGHLERFRRFIEERGRETEAWRGEIREDKTADWAPPRHANCAGNPTES